MGVQKKPCQGCCHYEPWPEAATTVRCHIAQPGFPASGERCPAFLPLLEPMVPKVPFLRPLRILKGARGSAVNLVADGGLPRRKGTGTGKG